MPGPGLEPEVLAAVEAAVRADAADYIGETLTQNQADAAVATTVATLQRLQTEGTLPLNPVWRVQATPTGEITIQWQGQDTLVVS
jgi:hypothetical protein